jgi:hypothetical protein
VSHGNTLQVNQNPKSTIGVEKVKVKAESSKEKQRESYFHFPHPCLTSSKDYGSTWVACVGSV